MTECHIPALRRGRPYESLDKANVIDCRSGAVLATVVVGGFIAVSPLFLGATMNTSGRAFGSFGVVLTLIGCVFIMITLSLVCAVFSPVWAGWRAERDARTDDAG